MLENTKEVFSSPNHTARLGCLWGEATACKALANSNLDFQPSPQVDEPCPAASDMSHKVPHLSPFFQAGPPECPEETIAALTLLLPYSTALPCACSSIWHRCLCTSAQCYPQPGLGEPLPFGSGVDFCIGQPQRRGLAGAAGPGAQCCRVTGLGLIPTGSHPCRNLSGQPSLCSPPWSTVPALQPLPRCCTAQTWGVSAAPVLSSTLSSPALTLPWPKGGISTDSTGFYSSQRVCNSPSAG